MPQSQQCESLQEKNTTKSYYKENNKIIVLYKYKSEIRDHQNRAKII